MDQAEVKDNVYIYPDRKKDYKYLEFDKLLKKMNVTNKEKLFFKGVFYCNNEVAEYEEDEVLIEFSPCLKKDIYIENLILKALETNKKAQKIYLNEKQIIDFSSEKSHIFMHLSLMKAYSTGMKNLICFYALNKDRAKEKNYFSILVSVLEPVIKGYIPGKCFDVCSTGVRFFGRGVLGSKSFCFEDTNNYINDGLEQAYSLTKLLNNESLKNRPFLIFLNEIADTIEKASDLEGFRDLAKELKGFLEYYGECAVDLSRRLTNGKKQGSYLYLFLEATGDLSIAWMLLKTSLPGKKNDDKSFMDNKTTAAFFIHSVLPQTLGKLASLEKGSRAVEMMNPFF